MYLSICRVIKIDIAIDINIGISNIFTTYQYVQTYISFVDKLYILNDKEYIRVGGYDFYGYPPKHKATAFDVYNYSLKVA